VEVRSAPGNVVVLRLTGDHDLSTKPQLVAELAGVGPEAALVIDLTGCTFVDSTIIGAILAARVPSRPRMSLILPGDTSYVHRALSVVGMRDLVPVHASVEDALESFAEGRSG
jgi:anti-sigma B factor antagonist